MKNILIVFSALILTSCGIFGNSTNDDRYEKAIHQNKIEAAVKEEVLNTFDGYGLYENYTFTNSHKQQTIYHKRLNQLYEAKYQLNKVGILMGDSIRKINKEIDTLVPFIEKSNIKKLHVTEHFFGFEKDNKIQLIRGDYFVNNKYHVDSVNITFNHKISKSMHEALRHLIFEKAYMYHPNYALSDEERDFYNHTNEELWNRRNSDNTEESAFLDHSLTIINQMIKSEKYDINELTEFKIRRYLENKNFYSSIENVKFSDVFQVQIEENNSTGRKIYERSVNFSYLLNQKLLEEELLFQFNEFLEIIN
jgi:hypothetical protein